MNHKERVVKNFKDLIELGRGLLCNLDAKEYTEARRKWRKSSWRIIYND